MPAPTNVNEIPGGPQVITLTLAGRSLTVIETLINEEADVLINTSRGWVSVAETPHYSREIKTHTTASLAPNTTEKSILEMYPAWRAFKFSTNRPARVRVYRTAAQKTRMKVVRSKMILSETMVVCSRWSPPQFFPIFSVRLWTLLPMMWILRNSTFP